MLIEEAIWIGDKLREVCKSGDKVLNFGSSNLYSRTIAQPHMHNYIFEPLNNAGIQIIHTDIKADEGVDLVGDLTDENFNNKLKELSVDCLLCANLLEHIVDKNLIIEAINAIVPNGGYCIITVPYIYPYHLDPIDTMYRPTPQELTELFPEFEIIFSESVVANRLEGNKKKEKNYFQMLMHNPSLAIRLFSRSLLPFYKYKSWKITVKDLSKMFMDFQVSCVLLKKKKL